MHLGIICTRSIEHHQLEARMASIDEALRSSVTTPVCLWTKAWSSCFTLRQGKHKHDAQTRIIAVCTANLACCVPLLALLCRRGCGAHEHRQDPHARVIMLAIKHASRKEVSHLAFMNEAEAHGTVECQRSAAPAC